MEKWNVYVTRMLPQPALDLLSEHCDVEINLDDRVLTKVELIEKVKDRDAILCLLTDNIDADVLDSASPRCRIFANYAVGYNNIDVAHATDKGIIITNTPGVLTEATADIAWTLLFSVARRVVEADKFVRNGLFKGWGPMMFLGMDITGKTIGIFGAGRIGSNFAKKAKAFNMKILYNDISANSDFELQTGAIFVDKERLLRESDFVSLHVPLIPSTRHLIGEAEFKIMKKTAILINTSRGPVVDEKALVKALDEGDIWGAGLDVYENEPAIEPGLIGMDNVVLLPHIASATFETRINMGIIAVRNIIDAMQGAKPENCVNPEVL
ncbi:MAG: 2-hydroxyacid dehydrogenase [Saccharofermentanales bacterium]